MTAAERPLPDKELTVSRQETSALYAENLLDGPISSALRIINEKDGGGYVVPDHIVEEIKMRLRRIFNIPAGYSVYFAQLPDSNGVFMLGKELPSAGNWELDAEYLVFLVDIGKSDAVLTLQIDTGEIRVDGDEYTRTKVPQVIEKKKKRPKLV